MLAVHGPGVLTVFLIEFGLPNHILPPTSLIIYRLKILYIPGYICYNYPVISNGAEKCTIPE